MALTHTPLCEFGQPAVDFSLRDTDGRTWTLADCQGRRATLIMFICNHCPYVQAILARLVSTVRALQAEDIGSVAIMANDTEDYPEDNVQNMARIAQRMDFPFPYLIDETQQVARAYHAVCTPDFFAYNQDLSLQYRGAFDEQGKGEARRENRPLLAEALRQIAATGQGPEKQIPSMGCSIKWRAE